MRSESGRVGLSQGFSAADTPAPWAGFCCEGPALCIADGQQPPWAGPATRHKPECLQICPLSPAGKVALCWELLVAWIGWYQLREAHWMGLGKMFEDRINGISPPCLGFSSCF